MKCIHCQMQKVLPSKSSPSPWNMSTLDSRTVEMSCQDKSYSMVWKRLEKASTSKLQAAIPQCTAEWSFRTPPSIFDEYQHNTRCKETPPPSEIPDRGLSHWLETVSGSAWYRSILQTLQGTGGDHWAHPYNLSSLSWRKAENTPQAAKHGGICSTKMQDPIHA